MSGIVGNACKHRHEAGVTLVEQLIAVVIIAMMFAMLLPGMSHLYQHGELDMTARMIVSDIRSQQTSAWAHQDGHEVWFSKFRPQDTLWENGVFLSQTTYPQRISYLNGYLDQTVSDLRFDLHGIATGYGNMHVINQNGEQSDIAVYLATGITVYDGVHKR
jgi:Tfp pilus assembly protein FimT